MSRLETYCVENFPPKATLTENGFHSGTLFMFDECTHQGAFEFFEVGVYDDAMKQAARIGGVALLANVCFDGFINTRSGEGEVTVRHLASSHHSDAFSPNL